jgi:hypothetical protein
VLEGRDLLDGDLATAWTVDSRADDAIGTLADDIEDLVLCAWWKTEPGVFDDREHVKSHQR